MNVRLGTGVGLTSTVTVKGRLGIPKRCLLTVPRHPLMHYAGLIFLEMGWAGVMVTVERRTPPRGPCLVHVKS